MSAELINHSPDLKRLRDEGFSIEIKSGHLLVHDIPYVTSQKLVARGTLVSVLTLASSKLTAQPNSHVAEFMGAFPCKADGTPITGIFNCSQTQQLADGVVINHRFSARPLQPYTDYYAKITTYVGIISGQAQVVDPSVTPKTFRLIQTQEKETALKYFDTNASRAGIIPLMEKVAGLRIAIVGNGGTGAYALDLLAKCPVAEIHLWDGDLFQQHNAYRAPGAASEEDLSTHQTKVDYLAAKYGVMHSGIVAHPAYIDPQNVQELEGFDFVFICIDKPSVKQWLFRRLIEMKVSFIDTGIDVEKVEDQLIAMVRVTAADPAHHQHLLERVSFADQDAEQEYKANIQIAELNMLNAALAVIRWKRMLGFYSDQEHEFHSLYSINNAHLVNNDLAD